MSLSAAVIDAMISAGCTAEQLAAAVKADIAEDEARAARQVPWDALRQMAFARDGQICGWCGSEDGPFEIDHIVPRAKGGENLLSNVVVSCRSCNRAKKDRDEADWSQLHAKRVAARERKRLQRERDACDMSRRSPNKAPLNAPLNEKNLNPPFIPPTSKDDAGAMLDFGAVSEAIRLTSAAMLAAAKAAKAASYHRLPATWEPPADLPDKLAAKVALWPPGMVDDEADAFRAWAVNAKNENGKGRKLDWDQAWHNWLRGKHDEWQRRQPRLGGNQGPGNRKRTVSDLYADMRMAGVGGSRG